MFSSFSFGDLTLEALQAQIIGFLTNQFITGVILAVMALVLARMIAMSLKVILSFGRDYRVRSATKWNIPTALRTARWHLSGTAAKMYAMGEDPGDVDFWYDEEVRKGHGPPVGFRRTNAYRLKKHRARAG